MEGRVQRLRRKCLIVQMIAYYTNAEYHHCKSIAATVGRAEDVRKEVSVILCYESDDSSVEDFELMRLALSRNNTIDAVSRNLKHEP